MKLPNSKTTKYSRGHEKAADVGFVWLAQRDSDSLGHLALCVSLALQGERRGSSQQFKHEDPQTPPVDRLHSGGGASGKEKTGIKQA